MRIPAEKETKNKKNQNSGAIKITELKNSLERIIIRFDRQKKESVNWNTDNLK